VRTLLQHTGRPVPEVRQPLHQNRMRAKNPTGLVDQALLMWLPVVLRLLVHFALRGKTSRKSFSCLSPLIVFFYEFLTLQQKNKLCQ
jgi:hypothetical protein